MVHEPNGNQPSAPEAKRRGRTEERLRTALERLVAGMPTHPSLRGRSYRLTVAALAREARVGRNTIYTNHRSLIDDIDRAAPEPTLADRPDHDAKVAELGALIKQLQQQKRQLATENAALLKRAIDAEKMVDRLNEQHAKLVGELTAAHQPIVLPRRRA
jgi:hypothetical protein